MAVLLYIAFALAAFAVREIGCLLGALIFNVKIERLVLGIGPTLAKIGSGFQFVLRALPAAILVGMAGGTPGESRRDERGLFDKPFVVRFFVFAAGALACFVVGWGLLAVGSYLKPPPAALVGGVTPQSPAADAGLRTGDRIIGVDGQRVEYLFDLFKDVLQASGKPVSVEFRRGNETYVANLVTDECFSASGEFLPDQLGIEAPSLARVERVIQGQPAARSGLQAGEWIREVNGKPVTLWAEVVEAVQQSGGESLTLAVEGAAGRRDIQVKPEVQLLREESTGRVVLDESGVPLKRAMIGAVGDMGNLAEAEPSWGFALQHATQDSLRLAVQPLALLVEYIGPKDERRLEERARASLTVDIERGLIEAERPWFRIGAEVLLLFALVLLPLAVYHAFRGRRIVGALIAEDDAQEAQRGPRVRR